MALSDLTTGTQVISNQTDIAIGVAGKPTRVTNVIATSDGTATVVLMRNGTSTGGTALDQIDGTVSKSVRVNYGTGLLFPLGCFADVDSHTTVLTVSFSQEA